VLGLSGLKCGGCASLYAFARPKPSCSDDSHWKVEDQDADTGVQDTRGIVATVADVGLIPVASRGCALKDLNGRDSSFLD
jgi:hypothetical protein